MSVTDSLEQWRERAREAYEAEKQAAADAAELEIGKMFNDLRQLEDRRRMVRRLAGEGSQ